MTQYNVLFFIYIFERKIFAMHTNVMDETHTCINNFIAISYLPKFELICLRCSWRME